LPSSLKTCDIDIFFPRINFIEIKKPGIGRL